MRNEICTWRFAGRFQEKFYDRDTVAIPTDTNCFRGVSLAPELISMKNYRRFKLSQLRRKTSCDNLFGLILQTLNFCFISL